MQSPLIRFLAWLLTSNRAGGIWFAVGGLGALAVAMRVVPVIPGRSSSRWLKMSSLSAMALGFLAIALERFWYPTDVSGHSHLPGYSLAAVVLLVGVSLFVLGAVLLCILGVQRGVAEWMSERLGRPIAERRGWDYLQRLGARLRQPRPRHVATSPGEQAAFKNQSGG